MTDPSFLLIGLGRSGTTLFQNIINSHPKMYLSDECHWLPKSADAGLAYHRFCEVDSLAVNSIPDDSAWWEALRVMNRHLFAFCEKKVWGLQTIGLQNIRRLATLFQIYPDIPVIFLLRDPRDLLHSLYRTGIGNPTFAEDLYDSLKQVKELTNNVLSVQYESLCHDPEDTLRTVCDFLGTDFFPGMLSVMEKAVSHGDQEKISRNQQTEKWTRELSAAQLSSLSGSASKIEDLGYPIFDGEVELCCSSAIEQDFFSNEITLLDCNGIKQDHYHSYRGILKSHGTVSVVCNSESLTLKYKDLELKQVERLGKFCLFDLREHDTQPVSMHYHQNVKPVESGLDKIQKSRGRFFVYSTSSETRQFLTSQLYMQCINVEGIIDKAPEDKKVFIEHKEYSLISIVDYSWKEGDIILIPCPRIYHSVFRDLVLKGVPADAISLCI